MSPAHATVTPRLSMINVLATLDTSELRHIARCGNVPGYQSLTTAPALIEALLKVPELTPRVMLGFIEYPQLQALCRHLGEPCEGRAWQIIDRLVPHFDEGAGPHTHPNAHADTPPEAHP